MPTDEEIIEHIEELLARPSIQARVEKMVQEQLKGFIGQPLTSRLEEDVYRRASEGIRQILDTVAPQLIRTDRGGINLLNDGQGNITVQVTMELP